MARRSLLGSRILITGASQGIGRAIAAEAARRGAKVLAAARSEDQLVELAEGIRSQSGTIAVIKADITKAEDRCLIIEAAVRHFGGLDILINNAGIGATGHFADADPTRLRKIMEVNFFGLTETTRACLPLLRIGNRPAVVNISSIAGKRGIPARSEYSASKFAVQGFSQALRVELAPEGIDVILVCPGLTQTNFSQNMLEQKARMPMDHMRGMTAEQVARSTLDSIERGRREVILTFQGKLMVFVSRYLPSLADRIARRRVRSLFQDEIANRHQQKQEPAAV